MNTENTQPENENTEVQPVTEVPQEVEATQEEVQEILAQPEVELLEVQPDAAEPEQVSEEVEEKEAEEVPAYQNRMRTELEELSDKVTALDAFIQTAHFRMLPRAERLDMKAQLKHMIRYQTTLARRVSRLN